MATDTENEFAADAGLRWRQFKGRLFVWLLVLSTLFGVLSLVALFVVIGNDALGLAAVFAWVPVPILGSIPLPFSQWLLLYFAVLVAPMSAYTLYIRGSTLSVGGLTLDIPDEPARRAVNAKAFLSVFGFFTMAAVVFAVGYAVRPHDIAIYAVFVSIALGSVLEYRRRYGSNHLTGPAIPMSFLVGIVLARVLYAPIDGAISIIADWILFAAITTVPAAVALGVVGSSRISRRAGIASAALVLAGTGVAVGATLPQGIDPSLWVVMVAFFAAPVAVVAADTFVNRPAGRVGLLGPAVLIGCIATAGTIERALGIQGLESWLTPTLVLTGWNPVTPGEAGVYPQIVGSILIVTTMAILAFPVGIGAAIYLEEYAPSTGWRGRLATVLDVNISNLAGVPSVVYGLLGLSLFQNLFNLSPIQFGPLTITPETFGLAPNLVFAAAVTLGFLILPIVIVSSQEALRSVPDELRQGSYGLGASRWQTVRNVVLPEAIPGILTGTILALGRAIGETAPLVMIGVATTTFSAPEGLFSSATALPLQIFDSAFNAIPEYRTGVVAAASIVLLVLMLLMNATAIVIRNRYENN
jgi:phosphate transport system permease protein